MLTFANIRQEEVTADLALQEAVVAAEAARRADAAAAECLALEAAAEDPRALAGRPPLRSEVNNSEK